MTSPRPSVQALRGTSSSSFEIGIKANRVHTRGTTAPSSPRDGDLWYSETTKETYFYDSSRSIWLSVQEGCLIFGGNGTTTGGTFFEAHADIFYSATFGWIAPRAGRLVKLSYQRTNTATASFQAILNANTGSPAHSLLTSSLTGSVINLNTAFAQNDRLSFRNGGANQAGGPGSMSNALGQYYFRWSHDV